MSVSPCPMGAKLYHIHRQMMGQGVWPESLARGPGVGPFLPSFCLSASSFFFFFLFCFLFFKFIFFFSEFYRFDSWDNSGDFAQRLQEYH